MRHPPEIGHDSRQPPAQAGGAHEMRAEHCRGRTQNAGGMEIDARTKFIRADVATVVGDEENFPAVFHHRREPIDHVTGAR